MRRILWVVLLVPIGLQTKPVMSADDDLRSTVEILKKEVESLRGMKKDYDSVKQELETIKAATTPALSTTVDTAMDSKYGPNTPVTTTHGKLQIGLLAQIWYYNIQQGRRGFFDDPTVNKINDNNSIQDGSGFRTRRMELTFKMDLNENFTAVLMIDPARESGGYPQLPSDQGNYKRGNNIAPGVIGSNGTNGTAQGTQFQVGGSNWNGSSAVGDPRLLQNSYLTWHDCIPHHAVTIGQFKPHLGEEGVRDTSQLDFCERSMIGFQTDSRDQGAALDGYWWEVDNPETSAGNVTFSSMKANNRIRYQLGVFNGAGSYFTTGDNQNRPDNNYSKDIQGMFLIRPLWDDCLGHLELGVSYMGGNKGKGDQGNDPVNTPTNDLNRPQAWAFRWNTWARYRYGNVLSGLWSEAEWSEIHDREAPNSVLDVLGTGGAKAPDFSQNIGQPFTRQGFYVSSGYKMSESHLCNVPCRLKKFEFAGRFEQFQNIETANQVSPYKTDLFYTRVWTGGINYYISGHNAKIQANYNIVELPGDKSNPTRVFHDTKANNFVIHFQVAF